MKETQESRTRCITFELLPDDFKRLAKKAKQKAPPSISRHSVEFYSSARTAQSKVQS